VQSSRVPIFKKNRANCQRSGKEVSYNEGNALGHVPSHGRST
jgi:hypothetical protein